MNTTPTKPARPEKVVRAAPLAPALLSFCAWLVAELVGLEVLEAGLELETGGGAAAELGPTATDEPSTSACTVGLKVPVDPVNMNLAEKA